MRTRDGLRYPPTPGQVGSVEVVTWTPAGSPGANKTAAPPGPLAEPLVLRGYVTTQEVRWFLRRIKGTASDKAKQAWADQLNRSHRPFQPLPAGFTYISEHKRRRHW